MEYNYLFLFFVSFFSFREDTKKLEIYVMHHPHAKHNLLIHASAGCPARHVPRAASSLEDWQLHACILRVAHPTPCRAPASRCTAAVLKAQGVDLTNTVDATPTDATRKQSCNLQGRSFPRCDTQPKSLPAAGNNGRPRSKCWRTWKSKRTENKTARGNRNSPRW